jgi:hypothetical protein
MANIKLKWLFNKKLKMKLIILSTLIIFSMLSFSKNVSAQTNADLISKFKSKEEARKSRIEKFLKTNNIPVRGYDAKDNFMILKDIVNGTPTYTTTRNITNDIHIKQTVNGQKTDQLFNTEHKVVVGDGMLIESTNPLLEITLINSKMRTVFYNSFCNCTTYSLSLKNYPKGEYTMILKTEKSLNTSILKLN